MSDTQITKEARAFYVLATLAMVLLALNLLRLIGVVPLAFALVEGVSAGNLTEAWPEISRFLRSLVEILPTLIWMGGVWSARGMFARIAEGELFSVANSRALASIGAALLWGAGAAMVFVPWILSRIDGESGLSGVRVDQTPLVLAVIGGALLVVGRMMARASALQSELSEII
jgi:hypothetical protein